MIWSGVAPGHTGWGRTAHTSRWRYRRRIIGRRWTWKRSKKDVNCQIDPSALLLVSIEKLLRKSLRIIQIRTDRRNISWRRVVNRFTQPRYHAKYSNGTQATLLESECSRHYSKRATPLMLGKVILHAYICIKHTIHHKRWRLTCLNITSTSTPRQLTRTRKRFKFHIKKTMTSIKTAGYLTSLR